MIVTKRLTRSLVIALWFMFLTFPIIVIRVNTIENTIEWRWANLIRVGIGSFVISLIWCYLLERKQKEEGKNEKGNFVNFLRKRLVSFFPAEKNKIAIIVLSIFLLLFPFIPYVSLYQINIMTNAFLYVLLGLGLNIVVGMAGLLHLGYVAFYAAGAYTYALLHHHFGIGFWTALPLGALTATIFGLFLGVPVLRLRGDYLAIVTLGFGEITRLVLENWGEFTFGPSGIAGIPKPGFFGIDMDIHSSAVYIYYLTVVMCALTIVTVYRLQHSRIGRALVALREDEIASEAIGINTTLIKISAFILGSIWAGLAGVIFAAKTTFVNPASFTFLESAMILCIVVLGGMGSIPGVILGAFILVLAPEYLRAFSEYRMLIFGIILILMMVFRPQGLISGMKRTYRES
ncbi:MAG: branched-chain amino acid ABC transporter permease [Syntrophales bacterium]|nr:branched-chain amino acid ABC transporter permease [Syntrophales bacterium]